MSSIQLFNNGEFELRVTPDGDSFNVAAPSLARALGFHRSVELARHVPDEEKGYVLEHTPGGDQRVLYLTGVLPGARSAAARPDQGLGGS